MDRAEEDNAEAMLLNFLPYVDHPNYRVLLSIVSIPRGHFEFFAAFSDANATKDIKINKSAVAHAFAMNTGLLDRYSTFVMDRVSDSTAHPRQLAFWQATVKEALGILRSRNFSGEKIAQILVPSIARGFTARAQEAIFVVMQALCTSFSLSDEVLRALMVHIGRHWSSGSPNANLNNIALLSTLCEDVNAMSSIVYTFIKKADTDSVSSAFLSNPKFVTSFLLARLAESAVDDIHGTTETIVKQINLSEQYAASVITAQFNQWQRNNDQRALTSLTELIQWYAIGNDISTVIAGLKDAATREAFTKIAEEQLPHEIPSQTRKRKASDAEIKLMQLTDLPKIETRSFIDDDEVSVKYLHAFDVSVLKKTAFSPRELVENLDSPMLQTTLLLRTILSIDTSSKTAIEAIELLEAFVRTESPQPHDYQILIPFLFLALSSTSDRVRAGVASLFSTLHEQSASHDSSNLVLFGVEDFHCNVKDVKWLTVKEESIFLNQNILPYLSDFQLDHHFASKHFGRIVRFVGQDGKRGRQSTAILNFVCSHAISCPNHTIQYSFLTLLNSLEITSNPQAVSQKTTLLLPLVNDMHSSSKCQLSSTQQLRLILGIVGKGSSVKAVDYLVLYLQSNSAELVDVAAHQIEHIWPSLDESSIAALVPQLFNIALNGDGTTSKASKRILLSQKMPSSFFQTQLADIRISSPASTPDLNDRSRQSTSGSESVKNLSGSHKESLRSLTLLLELLESSTSTEMRVLLPALFHMLSQVLAVESSSKLHVLYVKQLILSCILSIIHMDENAPFDVKAVRLESLITCIRTSQSSHISNRALPILSFIANRAPETVLHHIMPIFTFMGSNLSRKDDRATASTIEATMHSIIPPLLNASKSRRSVSTVQMLQSFSNSIAHIPRHRRLPLFRTLLNILGRGESDLFLFLSLCKDTDMSDELAAESKDLLLSLFSDLDVASLLNTFDKILGFSLVKLSEKAPDTIPEIFTILSDKFDQSTVQGYQSRAILLLVQAFSFSPIQEVIRHSDLNPGTDAREHLTRILQALLELQQLRAINGFRVPSLKLLRLVLNLLPLTFFVGATKRLLNQDDEKLKISILEAATAEIAKSDSSKDENQQAIVDLLETVILLLEGSPRSQVALAVYRLLSPTCQQFGKTSVSALQSNYKVFMGDGGLSHSDKKVRLQTLEFLSGIQSVLGPRIVGYLPALVKLLADLSMQPSLSEDVDVSLWQFFAKLVRWIPNFMISYYPRLFELLLLSSNRFPHEKNRESRDKFMVNISKKGNHEVSIAACFGLQAEAVKLGPRVCSILLSHV